MVFIAFLVQIIFLIFKLVGVLEWGWLWVLSPIWITLLPGLILQLFAESFSLFRIGTRKRYLENQDIDSKSITDTKKRKGLVISGFVLGILSITLNLIFCWIPIISQLICIILGVLAIILGAISIKKIHEKKGLAIATLVLGIIGTVFSFISLVACGLVLSSGVFEEYAKNNVYRQLLFLSCA